MPDIFTEFYHVSYTAISWTAMLFSLTMVLLLPGAKNTVLLYRIAYTFFLRKYNNILFEKTVDSTRLLIKVLIKVLERALDTKLHTKLKNRLDTRGELCKYCSPK